jgi:hypothetical protein
MLLAHTSSAQTRPYYQVYAIRYATIPDFFVSGLVAGAEPSRKMNIAMMVWLVRGGGRNILVDSGFYRDRFFKQWKVTDYVRQDEAVRRAGVKPEDITDVIVTHLSTGITPMEWTFSLTRKSGCKKKSSSTTPVPPGNHTGPTAASIPMTSSLRSSSICKAESAW